jgi:hypothetical protein
MLKYAAFAAIAVIVLWALHLLGLWMERRGWIYYWHTRATSGAASAALGSAMQEMNALANPEVRHVVLEQRSDRKRDDQTDGRDADD